jgi:dihydrofolate reductase
MFISPDGFAAGVNKPAFFGFFGPELANWVRTELDRPQTTIMGRVTYQALAKISASACDESEALLIPGY